MKRNIKHYTDEAEHTHIRQHQKSDGNDFNRGEYLFDSETDSDRDRKDKKNTIVTSKKECICIG